MAEQKYEVVGACAVAGVAPGGTVTRAQVERFVGEKGHLNFEVLIGNHLKPVKASTSGGTSSGQAGDDKTAKP